MGHGSCNPIYKKSLHAYILKDLEITGGHISRTAHRLGITQRALEFIIAKEGWRERVTEIQKSKKIGRLSTKTTLDITRLCIGGKDE